MAIIIDEKSRVLVQGITGGAGVFHTKQMLSFGTKIVGGTSPGKGGQMVEGVPVFDTVAEAFDAVKPNVSVLFLPARFVLDATVEALEAGIETVIVVPEHIPIHDMLRIRRVALEHGGRVLGGNTAGIISPGKCNVGIIPPIAFQEGRVGTVSRSGSITYYMADTLTRAGYGESTCVGLGGDPILGSPFAEILPLFEADPQTEAVVLCGEIGGVYEEACAEVISTMKKPVLAFIGGRHAPVGKRMGHAGAIVEGNMGTADSKLAALTEAGAIRIDTFMDIPDILADKIGAPAAAAR